MSRASGKVVAIIAVALAAAAGAAWMLTRHRPGSQAVTEPAARDGGAATAERAGDGGAAAGSSASAGPSGRVQPIRQAPDSPERPQPYRPAKYLRYSEGMPAKTPAEDDASPILARILDLTKPNGEQESAIRAAWRAHEDGRRELLAKAHPASIGDPVLDPHELGEVDRAFDELLATTLRHEQLARLVLEMPPPEPEPDVESPPPAP